MLPDPDRRFEEVVLGQQVARPRPGPAFAWEEGAWRLSFRRPETDRLEYLIGVDGSFRARSANPLRAPGPFGDKSVIEWPEYEAPAWLSSIADAGPVERIELRCRRLVARVDVLLYATPEPPGVDAPLLVVHDGPEFAEYAGLTRFLDAMSWEERIPPLRAALIQPVDRDETYSASALYAGALVRELLPQITRLAPHGKRIGMGASLGALAMLHAQRRHPKAFDGLFLQSGSFFRQRWDKVESGFGRYQRITRFVGTVLRDGVGDSARARRDHLRDRGGEPREQPGDRRRAHEQGYAAWLAEIRDGHTWIVLAGCLRPQPAGADRGRVVTRRAIEIDGGTVLAYGHYGRPVVAFPSENGEAHDWESRGMVEALAGVLEAGKVKLYCLPSFDRESWTRARPLARGARRAARPLRALGARAARAVRAGGLSHAGADRNRNVVRRLPRGELLPQARRRVPAGDLHERRLRRLRPGWWQREAMPSTSTTRWTTSRISAATIWTGCARMRRCSSSAGRASGRTRPARSSRRSVSGRCSASTGIRHEVDLWGHDVPHDWPSWRRQIAHHLPRFL